MASSEDVAGGVGDHPRASECGVCSSTPAAGTAAGQEAGKPKEDSDGSTGGVSVKDSAVENVGQSGRSAAAPASESVGGSESGVAGAGIAQGACSELATGSGSSLPSADDTLSLTTDNTRRAVKRAMWVKTMGEKCWVYVHKSTGEVRFTPPHGESFELEKTKAEARTPLNLSSGQIWLTQLLEATDEMLDVERRTPLWLDTEDELVRTFYSYGNGIILDAKEMTLGHVHGVSLLRLRERARQSIVDAVKCGYTLVIAMSNSAPTFISNLCHPNFFPIELFDATKNRKEETWEPLFREADKDKYGQCVMQKGFKVVCISRFTKETYRTYLSSETPLSFLRAISVKAES